MSAIRTFNVEAGLPALDEARRLKVIHGYGSSGKGGALCVGLRKLFGLRKKEGVLRDDLSAANEGVTILWLK